MADRMRSTPRPNRARSRLVDQLVGSGPRHGAPRHGVAGRTTPNRAHTGSPSYGTTTAQKPVDSRAARSDVTSRRPEHSRSPTTASADPGTTGAYEAAENGLA